MTVAIIGGGISGAAIQRGCEAYGMETRMFSRSTGFDVLRDDATRALEGAEVIIDAAARFTTSRKVATDFFTRCSSSIAAASNALGARHILLSIVNCELPEVQGYGYFAGKAAQESVARAASDRLTVVRSTQWFEFAGQNLQRMKFGPIALVPSMKINPVSLDSVAKIIGEVAAGERSGPLYEVAGPEVMTLWEMTQSFPRRDTVPVPLSIPTSYGHAFRKGVLVPDDEVLRVGPTLTEWLSRRAK